LYRLQFFTNFILKNYSGTPFLFEKVLNGLK
jgi:hypothetical protein